MKRNHSKSLLSLCAGLVLCLCMTSCNADVTINVGDVDISITDTDTTESDEDENEKEEDASTQNPDNPDDSGDTPLDPENPDEGGDDDDGSDVVPDPEDESDIDFNNYQPYSFVFTSGMLTSTTDKELTSNGLTWYADKVTAAGFSSDVGVRIGTSSNPQTDPWTFTTNFGENVELRSVVLYVSNASSGTAHYEISFNEKTLGSGDFSSSNTIQRGPTGLSVVGSRLTISMNAVDSSGFYLQAVTLAVYTRENSKLSLSYDSGYEPNNSEDSSSESGPVIDPGVIVDDPDNPEDYIYEKTYTQRWESGEITPWGDGEDSEYHYVTAGGLTWSYTKFTVGGSRTGERGVQIGQSGAGQTEYITFSTNFGGETIKLTDVIIYVFSTTSGTGHYSISFNGNFLGEDDFHSDGATSDDVCEIEFSELDYFGGTLSISLKANSEAAIYFKGVSLTVLTTEDSKLNLEEEEMDDIIWEPGQAVTPGENKVKLTNYDPLVSKEDEGYDESEEQGTIEDYYAELDETIEAIENDEIEDENFDLRTYLRESFSPVTRTSYGNIRYMLPYTDEDPDNIGYMYGIYDGDAIPGYWSGSRCDREHVWACSHMRLTFDDKGDYRPKESSVGHYSDLHNLRICCKPVNTSKNDRYFGEVTDSSNFYANVSNPENIGSGNHRFENNPETDHRGDAARICLYQYVMYEELDLADGLAGEEANYTTFGQLSVLLEWNYADPVDEFEMQRNGRVYEYQGNRNPFIDYPELADYLFPNETQHFIN
ncbi:MAG: endonuclease [Coprobacillus sp.]|nr:endonuclease [Coprobacillus sp.]